MDGVTSAIHSAIGKQDAQRDLSKSTLAAAFRLENLEEDVGTKPFTDADVCPITMPDAQIPGITDEWLADAWIVNIAHDLQHCRTEKRNDPSFRVCAHFGAKSVSDVGAEQEVMKQYLTNMAKIAPDLTSLSVASYAATVISREVIKPSVAKALTEERVKQYCEALNAEILEAKAYRDACVASYDAPPPPMASGVAAACAVSFQASEGVEESKEEQIKDEAAAVVTPPEDGAVFVPMEKIVERTRQEVEQELAEEEAKEKEKEKAAGAGAATEQIRLVSQTNDADDENVALLGTAEELLRAEAQGSVGGRVKALRHGIDTFTDAQRRPGQHVAACVILDDPDRERNAPIVFLLPQPFETVDACRAYMKRMQPYLRRYRLRPIPIGTWISVQRLLDAQDSTDAERLYHSAGRQRIADAARVEAEQYKKQKADLKRSVREAVIKERVAKEEERAIEAAAQRARIGDAAKGTQIASAACVANAAACAAAASSRGVGSSAPFITPEEQAKFDAEADAAIAELLS